MSLALDGSTGICRGGREGVRELSRDEVWREDMESRVPAGGGWRAVGVASQLVCLLGKIGPTRESLAGKTWPVGWQRYLMRSWDGKRKKGGVIRLAWYDLPAT